jgi:FkbM family methyltransferase
MSYSQNSEQQYILEFFKGQETQISFLEVGAYNPFTFSNTRALVELGCNGIYVEPSPSCMQSFKDEYLKGRGYTQSVLSDCHIYSVANPFWNLNNNGAMDIGSNTIVLIQAAIGSEDKVVKFFDSKGDAISSTSVEHKDKWEAGYNVKYDEIEVQMLSMETLLSNIKKVDFLNLDVESTNIELFNLISDWFWERLKMICIEHDNQQDYIISKLQPFGFNELHRNGENLILAK